MALDIEFSSPEEEFESKKTMGIVPLQAPAAPPASIEFPGKEDNSVDETDIQPFEKPYEYPHDVKKETPGFFSSAFHEFKEDEVLAHGLNFAYQKYEKHHSENVSQDLSHQNPLDENIPDNWTAYEAKNFDGYDEQYWAYLGNAETPSELQLRQQEVTRLQQEQEYYKDGSTWGKVAGGIAAFVTDVPLFSYFPLVAALKYEKFGAQVVKNVVRQAPGIAAAGIAYTAAIDATTTGKTMSDFAQDAAVNALGSIFLTGAAAGLGHFVNGGALYGARDALKMNFQGIDIVKEVAKDGEILSYKAVPAPNSSAGAAEVTRAQEFLDSRIAKIGLFQLPYIGTGLEKGLKYVSPTYRGVTSQWETTNLYTNKMADHSIEVAGVTRGKVRPENFESLMLKYHTDGIQIGQRIEGYRNFANGIGGSGVVAASKRLKQRLTEGVTYSKDDWGRMVMTHLFTGEPSEVSEVNALGNELKEYYKNALNLYQRAHGLEEMDLPVKTAAEYLSRRYDTDAMSTISGESKWNDMCLEWFREGDQVIQEAMRPINEALERVNLIKQEIHNSINVDENRILLRQAKNLHARERDALKERARNDEALQIHLDERVTLTKAEEKALKNKLKPWKDSKRLLTTNRSNLSKAKNELSSLKEKFETGEPIIKKKGVVTPQKNYDELKSKINEVESRISNLESETEKLSNEVYIKHNELLNDVNEGKIKRNMYYKNDETGAINFKNPNETPKFRTLYSSHGDEAEARMLTDAKAYHASITGTNPDKLAQNMLNNFHGSVVGNPLGERSFMIPDERLLSYNFLSTDITRNATLYGLTLGRKTSLQSALKGFGTTKEGIHGVLDELTKEYERKKRVLKNLPKEKQDKAATKLRMSFDSEVKFIKAMHDVATGNYSGSIANENVRNYLNALRSFTAATRLGNLPLAQIPDLAAGIYYAGPWKYFRDGLLPAIKTMNGRINSAEGKMYQKSSSTAGLCLDHAIHSKSDQLWNFNTQSTQTFSGKVADTTSKLAKFANIASGSATIENFNQALIANISQSNLIDAMYNYRAGTLSSKEIRRLAQFGVDPEIWSPKIIKSFESSNGIAKKTGGYLSDYSNWKDKETRNIMAATISKSVRSTLIRRGMFDSPLISNDPVFSMLFTFTGWYFAAFNRYTVPALQRPFDSALITGTVATFGLGALVDPLRKWSKGEEFEMDNDHWFASALSNTTPFAPIYNAALRGNAFTNFKFLNDIKNDRYRKLTRIGIGGGPNAGQAEVLLHGLEMFGTGKWNQKDIKNLANSIPGMEMWYLNYWKDEFMNSLTSGLPKNINRAPGWNGEVD